MERYMKDNWEPVGSSYKITPRRAGIIFQEYLGKPIGISRLELLQGGLRNSNYLVEPANGDGTFLLRIYLEEDKGKNEAGILKMLKDKVPVPEVLLFDHSKKIIPGTYMIQSFIEGASMKDLLRDPSLEAEEKNLLFDKAARVLAKIHQVSFDSPVIDMDTYKAAVFPLLNNGPAGERLGKTTMDRVREYIEMNSTLLNGITGPARLVHADFNPNNILFCRREGEWEISAVLDWEYSFPQSHLFDLGNFLRYKNTEGRTARTFARSYREEGGTLPERWKEIIRYLDLIALLQMLNREKSGPNSQKDLLELIKITIG